jgi:16S rRNA (uracil1498-N3)-methyltransferase
VCAYAGGALEPLSAATVAPAPAPAIGVGFALVKSEKPEWIVQKLTECGVDHILPFTAARSVVRWDDAKAAKNLERLQRLRRVAVEAAMQSRRTWLPTVHPVQPFATVLAAGGAGVALADVDGEPATLDTPTVLVGPEGGWSEEERSAGSGRLVVFARSVLRAETAALAAALVLTGLRESVISPAKGRAPRS